MNFTYDRKEFTKQGYVWAEICEVEVRKGAFCGKEVFRGEITKLTHLRLNIIFPTAQLHHLRYCVNHDIKEVREHRKIGSQRSES